MAEDGGIAFARLFSQRRAELDLSVVDIAVQTGRPIEVVVGWDRGTAVPDSDDLAKVAQTLRLPKPLLKEAQRRAVVYRKVNPPLDSLPDAPSYREELPALVTKPGAEPAPATITESSIPPADAATAFASSAISTTSAVASTVAGALSNVLSAASDMFGDIRGAMSRRRRLARAPIAHPSYVEDRDQLITYRLRLVFTAAGVAALVLILRWSLGGLGSAIADLWEALNGAL